MLSSLFLSATNHLLAQAGWARQRLQTHAGRTARLELAPVAEIDFSISAEGQLAEWSGEDMPEVCLRLAVAELPQLLTGGMGTAMGHVRIEGNDVDGACPASPPSWPKLSASSSATCAGTQRKIWPACSVTSRPIAWSMADDGSPQKAGARSSGQVVALPNTLPKKLRCSCHARTYPDSHKRSSRYGMALLDWRSGSQGSKRHVEGHRFACHGATPDHCRRGHTPRRGEV